MPNSRVFDVVPAEQEDDERRVLREDGGFVIVPKTARKKIA